MLDDRFNCEQIPLHSEEYFVGQYALVTKPARTT